VTQECAEYSWTNWVALREDKSALIWPSPFFVAAFATGPIWHVAGQKLGIKEVDDGIWLASFMHYDLGYFDLEQKTLQPLDNPFGTRLSPMS
jgi:hypothetical protein